MGSYLLFVYCLSLSIWTIISLSPSVAESIPDSKHTGQLSRDERSGSDNNVNKDSLVVAIHTDVDRDNYLEEQQVLRLLISPNSDKGRKSSEPSHHPEISRKRSSVDNRKGEKKEILKWDGKKSEEAKKEKYVEDEAKKAKSKTAVTGTEETGQWKNLNTNSLESLSDASDKTQPNYQVDLKDTKDHNTISDQDAKDTPHRQDLGDVKNLSKQNLSDTLGKHDVSDTLGQQDVSDNLGQHDVSDTLGQHDVSDTLSQQDVSDNLGQQDVNDNLGQQDVSDTLAQQDVKVPKDKQVFNETLDQQDVKVPFDQHDAVDTVAQQDVSDSLDQQDAGDTLDQQDYNGTDYYSEEDNIYIYDDDDVNDTLSNNNDTDYYIDEDSVYIYDEPDQNDTLYQQDLNNTFYDQDVNGTLEQLDLNGTLDQELNNSVYQKDLNDTYYKEDHYIYDDDYDTFADDGNDNGSPTIISRKQFHRQVPLQAVAFLGAVGVFLFLLVVFFLYLNKALCFTNCGGFPCIDRLNKKDKAFTKLGTAYQYEDDSSSDSDDEVLRHYQSNLAAFARSGSMHGSIRSSKKSEKIKGPTVNGEIVIPGQIAAVDIDQTSLVEKGQGGEVLSSAGTDASQQSLLDDHESGSPETVKSVPVDLDDQHTYENKAFHTDQSLGSMTDSQQELSTTDRTLSNDEHLFDVSDLQGEPPLISKCGSLEVSFKYEAMRGKMHITIHQAREIPAKDRGGASNVQVRLMLLPTKKQKYKTKVKTGESPVFDETLAFGKIFPDDVNGMGIRVRLYGLERMRRERMIGESIVGFASLNLDEETTHWMVLEPRSNLSHGESGFDVSSLSKSDSASSTQSLQHGGMPELLIGLAYNGTTGRLSVQVIKGSNFRNMAMNRAPDTYVKLTLMSPTGEELQRCKTSVRRGQPNPLFKETFMFQVALFQLPEVTMMVSVYNKKSMKKKEMIGWFSLGLNSSGEEEGSHWSDMRENKGEEVCRWHVLLES